MLSVIFLCISLLYKYRSAQSITQYINPRYYKQQWTLNDIPTRQTHYDHSVLERIIIISFQFLVFELSRRKEMLSRCLISRRTWLTKNIFHTTPWISCGKERNEFLFSAIARLKAGSVVNSGTYSQSQSSKNSSPLLNMSLLGLELELMPITVTVQEQPSNNDCLISDKISCDQKQQ